MKLAALTLTFVILLTAPSHAKSIQIGDEVFNLADSQESNEGSIEEYVPRNQTLKNWRRLVGIRHFRKLNSPKRYIDSMASEYRKQYPKMKFETAGDKSTNQWVLDYLIYPRDGGPKFVEWNFFTARPSTKGGIVVYQFAVRAPYKESVAEAFEALEVPKLRRQMLPILRKSEFWLH